MIHKCACFTSSETWVNTSSRHWFNYRWNIEGHSDVILPFYFRYVRGWRQSEGKAFQRSILKTRSLENTTWWWVTVPQISKQCNYMVLVTTGSSALSLPLMMLNRQRLLWAYLITVHHAASFISLCSKKTHIKMTHFQVCSLWENN